MFAVIGMQNNSMDVRPMASMSEEELSMKLESYFSDLQRVQGSLETLKAGFKDATTLAFVEQNLGSLKNNYGSFYRTESFGDQAAQLTYRAEGIFSAIWEKIVAIWDWIVKKIKSLFGADEGTSEEIEKTAKEVENNVSAIKAKDLPVTEETKEFINKNLKNKEVPPESAPEVKDVIKDVAAGKEPPVTINQAIEKFKKSMGADEETINKEAEEKRKQKEAKQKEEEAKQKRTEIIEKKIGSKFFQLDKIFGGSYYYITERRCSIEVMEDYEYMRVIFDSFKESINRMIKFENLTPEKCIEAFNKSMSERGFDNNFELYKLSKEKSVICFMGNNKHLVITVEGSTIKTEIKTFTGKISKEKITVKDIEFISNNLKRTSEEIDTATVSYLKKAEEIKVLIEANKESSNKNLAEVVKQISSASTIIPKVVAHGKALNKTIASSLKELESFTKIIKDAGL